MKRKTYDLQKHRTPIFEWWGNEDSPEVMLHRKDRIQKSISFTIESGHTPYNWYICIDGTRINDDMPIVAHTLEEAIIKIKEIKIRLPYSKFSKGIDFFIVDALLSKLD